MRAALTLPLTLALLCQVSAPPDARASDLATAPTARKIPRETTIHGETRSDAYYWLREKTNPEVISYLEAENAYTAAVMKPLEALRESLYKEMIGRIKQTDLDVPYRDGDYFYYARTEEGKQYSILCRKQGSLDAGEQVILDLNELARGRKFVTVGPRDVSNDGNLLAYTIDVTGSREYTLFVKDLRTGTVLADRIPGVGPVAWATDNTTLFYGTEDAAKRPYRIYRHTLGADRKDDALVYEEKDELFRVGVNRSRDRTRIFLMSRSATTTEQRAIPADRPDAAATVILPREEGHEYFADHRAGQYYFRTNKGAREFRLVTAPVADPGPANWVELIGERPGTTIQSVALFRGDAVLSGSTEGLPFLEILNLEDGRTHRVAFPEPVCSVSLAANPEFGATTFRYNYQSLVTPASVFDYDIPSRASMLRKRTDVLGGFDPANYVSERIFATAADGTLIPIALVSRKTTSRDATAPLLLSGYGSYGTPFPVTFSAPNLSLLDRGVIYAIAQVRGGGDLGKAWRDAGKLQRKMNSFTDFIACADHLIAEKHTRRDRLVIRGAGAGGLLIGAVCNLRPDLCQAAVLEVPFVDVLNTMSDPSLPLTIQEYLEWGNPNIKAEYDYIKTYSPYDNIAPVKYPAMLIRTSLNDSQVPYWEPAKYVARMRATRTDTNPLMLKTIMDAGHGGASGRYDALKDVAFMFAFVLDQVGIDR